MWAVTTDGGTKLIPLSLKLRGLNFTPFSGFTAQQRVLGVTYPFYIKPYNNLKQKQKVKRFFLQDSARLADRRDQLIFLLNNIWGRNYLVTKLYLEAYDS
jgi:hypothetical protein